MTPQAALKAAHGILLADGPEGIKIPALDRFDFSENTIGRYIPFLRYAAQYNSLTGQITINSDLYREINSTNYEIFPGSLMHEIFHANQTWFENRIDTFDRDNPRHQALDTRANIYSMEVLGPKFKIETGCCEPRP